MGLRRSMVTGLGLLMLASLLLCRALEGLGFLLTVLPARDCYASCAGRTAEPYAGPVELLYGNRHGDRPADRPRVIEGLGWQGWWWCLALWTALMLPCLLTGIPADRQRQAARTLAPALGEGWGRRLRVALRAPGPWLVAICFGLYSSQWLSVIGFLPSIYRQAGLTGGQVGALTALVAAINVIGNLGSGQLMHHSIAPRQLFQVEFLAPGFFTFLAYSTLTEAMPLLRFAAVLLFSAWTG